MGSPARRIALVMALSPLASCVHHTSTPVGADATEAYSMLGRTLERPQMEPEQLARLKQDLANASGTLKLEPSSPDALIWVGRRLAYLSHFREAQDTFSVGIKRFPNDARFLRHRGHRYITLRRPLRAVEDLTAASRLIAGKPDEIEPDGVPNAKNVPLSTLHFNIWYHLGLAHYLNGDYTHALAAYDSCLTVSKNADLEVATSYWRYLTLRKLNRQAEADAALEIAKRNPEVIENGSYLKLLRLFAGLDSVQSLQPINNKSVESDPAIAYGISMWHLFNGREKQARDDWKRIVLYKQWPSFGVVAAEFELARVR